MSTNPETPSLSTANLFSMSEDDCVSSVGMRQVSVATQSLYTTYKEDSVISASRNRLPFTTFNVDQPNVKDDDSFLDECGVGSFLTVYPPFSRHNKKRSDFSEAPTVMAAPATPAEGSNPTRKNCFTSAPRYIRYTFFLSILLALIAGLILCLHFLSSNERGVAQSESSISNEDIQQFLSNKNSSNAPTPAPVKSEPSSAATKAPTKDVVENRPSVAPIISSPPTSYVIKVSTSSLSNRPPTEKPSASIAPSEEPSTNLSISTYPSMAPSLVPSKTPSAKPSRSLYPSMTPSLVPSWTPSAPTQVPSHVPTGTPSQPPTKSQFPTYVPTAAPTQTPSVSPSRAPSFAPSEVPTVENKGMKKTKDNKMI